MFFTLEENIRLSARDISQYVLILFRYKSNKISEYIVMSLLVHHYRCMAT